MIKPRLLKAFRHSLEHPFSFLLPNESENGRMLWLGQRMSRRAFIELLKMAAGLAAGTAVGIPLGARLLRDAQVSGQAEPASTPERSTGGGPSVTRSPVRTAVPTRPAGGSLSAVVWLPDTVKRWAVEAEAAGGSYGVDPRLVALLILCRSGGNPYAVDREGALGLMQVKAFHAGDANLFDPAANVAIGVRYLAEQKARFGEWATAVTAYDDGPGRVSKGTVTSEGEAFAKSVTQMWAEVDQRKSPAFEAWAAGRGASLLRKAAELDAAPLVRKAVGFAVRQWGKPYLWAGEGPERWDCSALVQAAWRHAGLEIPRTVTEQWLGPGRVLQDGKDARASDLVFFALNDSSTDHVGMIIYPPDVYIEASGQAGLVRVSSLDAESELFRADLAKRMLGLKRIG
jgi:cell wall-associated NlpC family hydrolase